MKKRAMNLKESNEGYMRRIVREEKEGGGKMKLYKPFLESLFSFYIAFYTEDALNTLS